MDGWTDRWTDGWTDGLELLVGGKYLKLVDLRKFSRILRGKFLKFSIKQKKQAFLLQIETEKL